MSKSITITDSNYTVKGVVTEVETGKGILDLHVIAYDKDHWTADDFLGIAVTNNKGEFTLTFPAANFRKPFERKPDIYFIIKDAGLELLSTKKYPINNADESAPPITFSVSLKGDKLREDINPTPVPGWLGGFEESNPAFAYPPEVPKDKEKEAKRPDLSSLPMLDNLDNIDLLTRQQKVLWPEFSWETDPGQPNSKRCYQMFAPDISRLGYTDEGRVYSIICPQQGASSDLLGSMNVEVTVTGNRGWANEKNRELAADMTVEGKIWFSPGTLENNRFIKSFLRHFNKRNMPFPVSKEHAIRVSTFKPGHPDQLIFPLRKGSSTDFPIPDFAKHEEISWTLGHLGVEIGPIVPTEFEEVNKFNQFILNVFNIASGNMLKEGNTLTWNVWFTAPELVVTQEWKDHAEVWRKSIDVDHCSPEGPGTDARYFDGTPFKPLKEAILEELKIVGKHLIESGVELI